MILSYKKKFPFNNQPTDFEYKIKAGIKKHSIRDDNHDRWQPGMKIHHAHGARTKYYHQFAEGICVSTQTIMISFIYQGMYDSTPEYSFDINGQRYAVFIDSRLLNHQEVRTLAYNDGFDSIEDFFLWFNKPTIKKIIHWTDLKY